MADVEYSVLANLGVEGGGKFKSEMSSAAGGVKQFASGVGGVASQVASLGASAVAMAAKVAAIGGGVISAVGGVAAVAVGRNLSMLEDKSIQLGAVMAAATGTPFESMRAKSNELFAQFRKDAITSAGETQDFVGVASNLAGPLLGAGRSMEDLHKITQGVIATAPALGTSFTQAGTDVMRMFQGSAGAELPFFKALQSIPELGIKSAEAFNKMDVQKRIEVTEKALRNPAFLAAANAMGDTFTGLSSTVQDQLKTMGGAIGGPIFTQVKHGMKALTDLFMPKLDAGSAFMQSLSRMGTDVTASLSRMGSRWGAIFDRPGDMIDRMADGLERGVFATMGRIEQVSVYLSDHWSQIKDGAHEFGVKLEHAYDTAKQIVTALGGGDLGTGIKRLAEGFAGVKAGEAVAPMASSALTAAGGAAQLGKAAGLFGGASGAAAAAGGTEAGGAAATAAAAGSGIAASTVAIAAAVVAALGLAIVDAWESNIGGVRQDFEQILGWLKTSFGDLWDALIKLHDALRPLLNIIGYLLIGVVGVLIAALSLLAETLAQIIKGVAFLVDWLLNLDVAFNALVRNVTELADATESVGSALTTFVAVAREFYSIAEKLGLVNKRKLGPTDDTQFNRGNDDLIGPGIAFDTNGPVVATKKGGSSPKAGGAKQQIEVKLKIDLNGGDDADAIFIRHKKSLARAIQDAANQARISTSTIRGVTT